MKQTIGALLILGLLAGVAAPAAAWGNRVIIIDGNQVVTTPPNVVYGPRSYNYTPYYYTPYYYTPYSSVPFYYKPPYVSYSTPPVYAPGYWSYQWVPQVYTTYVWVHSYWSVDGRLVQAHYAPRVVDAGSWQRVWVAY